MDLKKKGIFFSIISLMISVLLITIFSASLKINYSSDFAQINSRAEMIDTTFNIISLNIQSMIFASSKETLKNMAEASYYLYNNNTYTPYDMDASCEFNNLMNGEKIKIINGTNTTKDFLFEIPGAVEMNGCLGVSEQSISGISYFYIQKFVPTAQLYTNKINLGIKMNDNDIARISILNKCKKEIVFNQSKFINSTNFCSGGTEITFNKFIQFNKGETYYLKIIGTTGTILLIPNNDVLPFEIIKQKNDTEDMSLQYYGYDPKINKTVIDYLFYVKQFLLKYYQISSDYEINKISIRQENPWEVIVEGDVKVKLNDSFFNITKLIPYSVIVDLEGLPDPLMKKYRETRIIRSEKKTQETKINYSYLENLYVNKTYIKDSRSPKYLDRFSSNFTRSTCCGFETFINPNDALNEDDALNDLENKSMSAWMLFTEKKFCKDNETEIFSVETTSGKIPGNGGINFVLDETTLAKFDINETTTEITINNMCS